MKRLFNYLPFFILVALFFTSCLPDNDFDELLLIGKWRSVPAYGTGTEYYRYDVGGTGVTWDTSDDVTEAEGQAYKWTLIKSELSILHIIELGGAIPKNYTVTQLTETTLKYKDDFNNNYSFTKVNP